MLFQTKSRIRYMIRFMRKWKDAVLFLLIVISVFSSFRFFGKWSYFWPYLLVQSSVAHGIYSYLSGGRIYTILGAITSADADPQERAFMGGMLFLIYIGMLFL